MAGSIAASGTLAQHTFLCTNRNTDAISLNPTQRAYSPKNCGTDPPALGDIRGRPERARAWATFESICKKAPRFTRRHNFGSLLGVLPRYPPILNSKEETYASSDLVHHRWFDRGVGCEIAHAHAPVASLDDRARDRWLDYRRTSDAHLFASQAWRAISSRRN